MKTKKRIIIGTSIALLVLILSVCVYNAFANEEFWMMNIGQALTPTVAIVIAFIATQFKTDERKAKEGMEKVLRKIQDIVTDNKFYCFSLQTDTKAVNITNRRMGNCITSLKKYAVEFDFVTEASYIEEQFKNYKDIVSEKMEDMKYLQDSEIVFKKYADNIDSKCDEIIVDLYTNRKKVRK